MDLNIIYGYITILILILISLIVFMFVLCNEETFNNFRFFLIALGVGALSGDAILHILPDILQKYEMGPDGTIIEKDTSLTLISILIVAGFIVSFIIEKFLHSHTHDHGHELVDSIQTPHHHHDDDSDHDDHELGKKKMTISQLLKQGFIINLLMGDIVHNFVDGMGIMASYLKSYEVGIASAIAIGLHEIPHEVSNFAAFRKNASFRQAVFLNFFGALSSLLGGSLMLVAVGVQDVTDYILAFGAGNFLYVSSAILIPELEYRFYNVNVRVQQAFQICGILIGVGIMYLILFYEKIMDIDH